MICIEDYEFSYDLFLAEQSLFEDVVDINNTILKEDSGIISINEGIKDTILKYLTKIKNAVQKVWEKFKNMLTDAVDGKYLNMIRNRVKEFDPNCEISNFPEINDDKFGSLKAKEFDYNNMKGVLDSVDHYIDTTYGSIIPKTDPNQNLDQRVQANCIELTTILCHNPELMKIYNYVTNGFKDDIRILEDDIKALNNSNDNITSIADSIINSNDIRNANASYTYDLIGYNSINEGPSDVQGAPAGSMMKGGNNNRNNANTQTQTQTTRVETNINNSNNKDAADTNLGFKQQEDPQTEEDKEKRNQIIKDIQVYMSATCSLFSAKMKVCRNKYKKYMKVLRHFIPITNAVANRNKPEQKVTNINKSKYEIKV